eukprot:5868554-Prymnesium_polylepis.2
MSSSASRPPANAAGTLADARRDAPAPVSSTTRATGARSRQLLTVRRAYVARGVSASGARSIARLARIE